MARYDRGYGGPRGGWRGQGMGRGFPEPGLPPFRQRGQGYAGGDWSRGGAGGPPFRSPGFDGVGGFHGSPDRPDRGRPPFRAAGFDGVGGLHGSPDPSRDRGVYGGAYEEFGGYPGGPARGGFYGGRGDGRPSRQRGYDAGWGGGYAREPFMPEEAYRRHPEYRQERQRRDWEAHQHGYGGDEPADDEVRAAVQRRMSADAWLDPARIDVAVEDGVVTLTGEVNDYLEARYAWDDAWEADGVRGVIDHLTVRADQPHEPHGDVLVQSAGDSTTPDEAELGD